MSQPQRPFTLLFKTSINRLRSLLISPERSLQGRRAIAVTTNHQVAN
ncbi:MAG: hypothetical protein V7K35_26640 [Nostoc sp.]